MRPKDEFGFGLVGGPFSPQDRKTRTAACENGKKIGRIRRKEDVRIDIQPTLPFFCSSASRRTIQAYEERLASWTVGLDQVRSLSSPQDRKKTAQNKRETTSVRKTWWIDIQPTFLFAIHPWPRGTPFTTAHTQKRIETKKKWSPWNGALKRTNRLIERALSRLPFQFQLGPARLLPNQSSSRRKKIIGKRLISSPFDFGFGFQFPFSIFSRLFSRSVGWISRPARARDEKPKNKTAFVFFS